MGLGVSQVDWTTTFDLSVKVTLGDVLVEINGVPVPSTSLGLGEVEVEITGNLNPNGGERASEREREKEREREQSARGLPEACSVPEVRGGVRSPFRRALGNVLVEINGVPVTETQSQTWA